VYPVFKGCISFAIFFMFVSSILLLFPGHHLPEDCCNPGPQVQVHKKVALKVHLQLNVLVTVCCCKCRYQPCIKQKIIRVNVQFKSAQPDAPGNVPELFQKFPARLPFTYLLLCFLPFISASFFHSQRINCEGYKKDPATNDEQSCFRNHSCRNDTRQHESVKVPGCIECYNHRSQQDPEQQDGK
jgi:hypothetical protein